MRSPNPDTRHCSELRRGASTIPRIGVNADSRRNCDEAYNRTRNASAAQSSRDRSHAHYYKCACLRGALASELTPRCIRWYGYPLVRICELASTHCDCHLGGTGSNKNRVTAGLRQGVPAVLARGADCTSLCLRFCNNWGAHRGDDLAHTCRQAGTWNGNETLNCDYIFLWLFAPWCTGVNGRAHPAIV